MAAHMTKDVDRQPESGTLSDNKDMLLAEMHDDHMSRLHEQGNYSYM
jgi:hypothetical protein